MCFKSYPCVACTTTQQSPPRAIPSHLQYPAPGGPVHTHPDRRILNSGRHHRVPDSGTASDRRTTYSAAAGAARAADRHCGPCSAHRCCNGTCRSCGWPCCSACLPHPVRRQVSAQNQQSSQAVVHLFTCQQAIAYASWQGIHKAAPCHFLPAEQEPLHAQPASAGQEEAISLLAFFRSSILTAWRAVPRGANCECLRGQ